MLLLWPLGADYRPQYALLELTYWVTLIAGMMALIGLRTNLGLWIFALGNLFIQAYIYSFGDFHHPEALMLITLLILAFSPAGGVLSVDDLWRRLQLNSKERKFEKFDITKEQSIFAGWPILLIQWMVSMIYLSSALWKLAKGGTTWMNGYTLQYYLLQDGLRWGSNLGVWLGQHHSLVRMLSWLTILFEGTFFAVLIFPRLAWFYVPMGAALHTGIYLAMRAPFFQYLAIYAIFVPWARLVGTVSRSLGFRAKAEVFYDGQCPSCIRSMTLLGYFDWFNRLTFSNLETGWQYLAEARREISAEDCRGEMHLLLPDGSLRKGFFAFRETFKRLPALWPLLLAFYLPGASTFGPEIYSWFASKRLRLHICGTETCSVHSNRK